jgi:pilus assembly protein Flp/PilA
LALVFLAAVTAVSNVAKSTSTMWNDVSTAAQNNM